MNVIKRFNELRPLESDGYGNKFQVPHSTEAAAIVVLAEVLERIAHVLEVQNGQEKR